MTNMIKNLLGFLRGVIVHYYPHLDNGVLEECFQVSYIWGMQVVISLTATFIVCVIMLGLFNNIFNLMNADKRAARKFWARLYKKL